LLRNLQVNPSAVDLAPPVLGDEPFVGEGGEIKHREAPNANDA
jgi:hypothetical protein